MSITTSRTSGNATITIDHSKCTACGICVHVCKDFSLELKDKVLRETTNPLFGCIGCGHCVAVCPEDAIMVTGRTLSETDYYQLPEESAGYEALRGLMEKRRSIRDFKDKPVPQELIDKIMEAASTAPMGLPPSDVGVLVLNSKEKVREFSFEFIDVLKSMKFMVHPAVLPLMRPFMKKEDYNMMGEFIRPLINFMIDSKKVDKNYLLYDAPLAFMFYGKVSDPADPYIACTYAMLAAESLGLGTCMIGSVGPFLKRTGKDFKAKYNLPQRLNDSLMLIVGYQKYKFRKGIRRTFAQIEG